MTKLRNTAVIAAAALALGSCGGSDEEGDAGAQVGDCVDDSSQVVDCSSSEAQFELVSDLDAPDAIACIVIDDPPQEEVEVDDGRFCAEPLE